MPQPSNKLIMRTHTKIILSFILIQLSIVVFASDDINPDTLNLPKKALIISESSTTAGIIYTMIDLENNEMVIVYYGTKSLIEYFRLQKVIRTGIILDPEKQIRLIRAYQIDERKDN
jgi:hypothetical protein